MKQFRGSGILKNMGGREGWGQKLFCQCPERQSAFGFPKANNFHRSNLLNISHSHYLSTAAIHPYSWKSCKRMRQYQIRVHFESRGMQFFKVLKKGFWMTKYVPIIVLWCSERGFYKKSHLITCFRRFTDAPNHLAAYVAILGWVDFGKNPKSCLYSHWIFRVLH